MNASNETVELVSGGDVPVSLEDEQRKEEI
jgi:hypothetical protein